MEKSKFRVALTLLVCMAMFLSNVCVYAAEVGTLYDGTGNLEIADPTYFDDEKTQKRFTGNGNIAGNYGKAVTDKVYKLEGYSASNGGAKDYISYWTFDRKTDKFLLETQVCLTDNTTNIDFLMGFFTDDNSDGNNNQAGGNVFQITSNGKLKTIGKQGTTKYFPDEWIDKEITTLEKYRWYNIAMSFSMSENKICIYLDGELKADITMAMQMYGLRHFRIATGLAPDEKNQVPFEAYIDNMQVIRDTSYNPAHKTKTSVTSNKYTISNNVISLTSVDASAADVLENVSAAGANIRIYQDAQMTKQIVNDEAITEDSILVCATKDDDGTEWTYNYYKFSLPSDENGLYSGKKTLNLAKNTSLGIEGGAQELTYPTAGNYGKKANDFTYFWKGETIGSGGHLYISWESAPAATPAEVFEFSFLLGEGSTGFNFGPAMFFRKSDGTDDTNFVNLYPFSFTLEDGMVVKNMGSANIKNLGYSLDDTQYMFDSQARDKKLCDIEKNRWYSVTFVFPADGSNKCLCYVNGEKHELGLNFNQGRIRHLRIYANKCDNQNLYFDNFKISAMTVDAAKNYVCRDQKEKVEFSEYEVKDNVVYDILPQTTVADFKNKITTDATIRIYDDKKCTNLLSDSDFITNQTTIVAASDNGTLHERVYDYYSVTIADDYDELSGGVRIENLKLTDNDGNDVLNENTALDEYYAVLKAKNLSETTQQVTLAIAVYDEELTIEDIHIEKFDLEPGEVKTFTVSDDVKIANSLEKGSVYTYAWLADSMNPICDSVHVDFTSGK